MVTPNTLDSVISNIQNFSGKSTKLSETLNQSAELLDTGTASTAVSQISELISQQSNMSCLLYTSPSPRDVEESRMPSSA